jgi:predicted Zn-dependent protease with MMP-like domain
MAEPAAFTRPPTAADLEAMAERALAAIPEMLRRHLSGVTIAVEELADDATLDELDIESAWDLTGLYQGVPRPLRSELDPPRQPDLIVLYRQAILLEWVETDEDLAKLVASVLVHEAAHHFGFSDADIEAIERAM